MNLVMWQSLTEKYEEAMRNIGEAVTRVEKFTDLASKQALMIDMEIFRKLVNPEKTTPGAGRLPCYMLPVAPNSRFFGRRKILDTIDWQLMPPDSPRSLHSLTNHGLVGIG